MLGVQANPCGVQVRTAAGAEQFDQVVLATHADQSLAMLADATDAERQVLGAIPYQLNETVLHTDASLLPRNAKAWAAWNAFVPRGREEPCTVSYCMNLLQGLKTSTPLIVTLNRTDAIAPGKILRRMQYHHPVYSHGSVQRTGAARTRSRASAASGLPGPTGAGASTRTGCAAPWKCAAAWARRRGWAGARA